MHFNITPPEVTFVGETSARFFEGAMSYIKLQQVSPKLHLTVLFGTIDAPSIEEKN